MKYRYLNESLWDDAEIDNDEIEQSPAEVKSSLEQNYSDYILNAAYDAIDELDHSYYFSGIIDSIAQLDSSSDYPESLRPFPYDSGFAIYHYYKKLHDTDDIEELQKYLIIPLNIIRNEYNLKNNVRIAMSVIYKHIPKVLKNKYESLYDLPFTILIYRSKLTPVDGKFILQQIYGPPETIDITYYDKFKNIKMIGIDMVYPRSFPKSNDMSVSISCNDFDKNFKTDLSGEIGRISSDCGIMDIFVYAENKGRLKARNFFSKIPHFNFSIPKDIVFPLSEVAYCGRMLPSPSDADLYLRARYGNYELLPKHKNAYEHAALKERVIFFPEEDR